MSLSDFSGFPELAWSIKYLCVFCGMRRSAFGLGINNTTFPGNYTTKSVADKEGGRTCSTQTRPAMRTVDIFLVNKHQKAVFHRRWGATFLVDEQVRSHVGSCKAKSHNNDPNIHAAFGKHKHTQLRIFIRIQHNGNIKKKAEQNGQPHPPQRCVQAAGIHRI